MPADFWEGGRFMPPVAVASTSAPVGSRPRNQCVISSASCWLGTRKSISAVQGAALDRQDETAGKRARRGGPGAVAAELHDQAVFVPLGGGLDALPRGQAAALRLRQSQ